MKKSLLSCFIFFGFCSVSSLVLAQSLQGDARAGESKAASCIGCHGIVGYQASFPQVHKVPMISGQSATYLSEALKGYAKGDRKHPTMRAIAGSLSEQDMADLGAFYAQHSSAPLTKSLAGRQDMTASGAASSVAKPIIAPSQETALLLSRGGCVACHGSDFNSPATASIPKLAGQHADYLYVALKSYQIADNSLIGRNNGSMMGMVQSFSSKELRLMANYFASLPGDLAVVPQQRFR